MSCLTAISDREVSDNNYECKTIKKTNAVIIIAYNILSGLSSLYKLLYVLVICCNSYSKETIEHYEKLILSEKEKAKHYQLLTSAEKYKPSSDDPPAGKYILFFTYILRIILLPSFSSLVDYGTFDFVIAGSGSTGSVIASRLSEIKDWNILVLEAGEFGNEFTDITKMGYDVNILSAYNWGYYSVPQKPPA
ncbi:hypothetical protein NQ315_002245 [Exocentrus adspersus]|uniref:Glucose-methanol-choline oxidoreductase N-terminal domain-containing protein n=1 Tax=Exocentrus adspersus TaxID=1586481 RepID=A0AAV8VZF4_9CUCU|nr:hypothetical protein NQ315_002245 [Exocentrus adspersus]